MQLSRLLPGIALSIALVLPAFGLAQTGKAPARPGVSAPAAASAATPAVPATGPSNDDYILGPEDVIDVQVLGTDFHVHGRIGQDNAIPVPYLGQVTAGGQTTRQFGEKLADQLKTKGYFTKPIVQVEIAGFASRNITVLGSVGTPGVVPVDRPYRVSEIIARVGGVRDDGADYVVLTPANGGTAKHLALKDLATGGPEQDPFVQPGDKLYAPKAELFYVSGEVRSPGTYPISPPGMTLRMALARAGGVSDQGSESSVKVNRGGKVVKVQLDAKIEPGDIIAVGERLF